MARRIGDPEWPRPEDIARAKQLMGLDKEWPVLTETDKNHLLPSEARREAFDRIEAETSPAPAHAKQKRGIAATVLERRLLDTGVLRNKETVYLGSGVDVEYPLALGARHIALVEYQFNLEKALKLLAQKIKGITGEDPKIEGNKIFFQMDYGEGPEAASITIESKFYNPQTPDLEQKYGRYDLPADVGLILEYAPSGPVGSVEHEEGIEQKLAEGGAILNGTKLTRKTKDGIETIDLKD